MDFKLFSIIKITAVIYIYFNCDIFKYKVTERRKFKRRMDRIRYLTRVIYVPESIAVTNFHIDKYEF